MATAQLFVLPDFYVDVLVDGAQWGTESGGRLGLAIRDG
jgi:hypothetical protein